MVRRRYKPGRRARKMYSHYESHGTAGMTKRQLRALAREMDLINPGRRHRRRLLTRHRRNPSIFDDPRDGYTVTSNGEHYRVSSKYVSYQDLGSGWYIVARGLAEHAVDAAIAKDQAKVRESCRNPKRDGTPFEAKVRAQLVEARAALARDSDRAHSGSRHYSLKRRVEQLEAKLAQVGKRRNPVLMNPKRDGTPTRGEKRAVKREAWLRTVMQRGKDAEAILSRVKAVPATSPAAVKEHVPEALKVIEQVAPVAVAQAAPAIAAAVEHEEANYLKSRIQDLSELIADLERDIEKADAAGEDAEAEDLMDQKIKLVRQKKSLKDKADGMGITLTNPGRRRVKSVLVGLKAYGRALKAYRSALRSKKRR